MLKLTLNTDGLSLREQQELEALKRDLEESLNDPRPPIPHAQVMEGARRYVEKKMRDYLANAGDV